MYCTLLGLVFLHQMLSLRVAIGLPTVDTKQVTEHKSGSTTTSSVLDLRPNSNTHGAGLPPSTTSSSQTKRNARSSSTGSRGIQHRQTTSKQSQKIGRGGTKTTPLPDSKMATAKWSTTAGDFVRSSKPTDHTVHISAQPAVVSAFTNYYKFNSTAASAGTEITPTELTQTSLSASEEYSSTSAADRDLVPTEMFDQSTADVVIHSNSADYETSTATQSDAETSGSATITTSGDNLATEQQSRMPTTDVDSEETTQHVTEEYHPPSSQTTTPTAPPRFLGPISCWRKTNTSLTFVFNTSFDLPNITAHLHKENKVIDHECQPQAKRLRNSLTTINYECHSLEPGTTYTINVRSTSGNYSQTNSCQTSEGLPSKVRNVTVKVNDQRSIVIEWEEPENPRASRLTYVVSVESENYNCKLYGNQQTINKKRVTMPNATAGCTYKIKVAAKTSAGTGWYFETAVTVPQNNNEDGNDDNNKTIVVVVTLCVVCLLLTVILLIFLLRNHPRLLTTITGRSRQNGTNMIDMPAVFSNPVKHQDYPSHVKTLSKDSGLLLSDEFEALKFIGRDQPCEASLQQCNRTKNRYTNILPYDHSRVKLIPVDDVEGCDYVNANWIPGYNSRREFIATQGPMISTRDDFWRMIWEYNCKAIVMLTQCTESNKIKCEQYWPPDWEPQFYGDLQVRILSTKKSANWVTSEIHISLGERKRTIKHFHYLEWADMKVPDTVSMLDFVRMTRAHANSKIGGPVVVHCSAGVGRTGTFIAIDTLLQQLQNDDVLDVFGVVIKLRMNRLLMVQTEQQYAFVYECLLHALRSQGRIHENCTETTLADTDARADNMSNENCSDDDASTDDSEGDTDDQPKTFKF